MSSADFRSAADTRPNIPLMSLPMIFKTDHHNIPASTPYLFTNDPTPDRLKILQPAGGLSVGLVWASNPDNKAMYRNKSISLELLMPHLQSALDLNLIELHCLQFGDDNSQLDPWRHLVSG